MPLTSADDISLVLSGGTVNLNPNASLGGEPSSNPITSAVLNNLFADISSDQSTDGYEDYRCIYMFNDGQTSVYSIEVWISSDDDDGSTMEIGIEDQNENQRITISGAALTGGSLTLSYKGKTFTTNRNSDLGVWATDIQTKILAMTDDDDKKFFNSVSVIAQNAGASTVIFDIIFSGIDAKRNWDKFNVETNSLSPSGVNVLITTPKEGAPINTIASEINLETTPPGGVGFFAASEISPITIPVLHPNEGFPLWIKRTTPPGTLAKENDGFILSFKAESLAP